jgi:hypothetical protein
MKCKVLNPAKQCALEDESDGTYLRNQPSSSRKRVFYFGFKKVYSAIKRESNIYFLPKINDYEEED